jgi:serine protease Do
MKQVRAAAPVVLALLAAAALVGCTAGGSSGGKKSTRAAKAEVDAAVARVFPALVRIQVVTNMHWGGREQKFQAAGSGTIISPDGYVVTNHHVVGKAKYIRCLLANKDEADARLIGTDALCDIAVIKLVPSTMRKPVAKFPFAEWGDSSALKKGDRVMAMGSPYALSQSVTLGIVSNTEMVIPKFLGGASLFKLDGEPVGTLVRWIAHDAAIYGGNSGGPLVDMGGRIVGVNEIGIGLGGAIPGDLARSVAEELIRSGEVKRSWIGAEVQPLLRGSKLDRGVLVGGVIKGSPAEKAGVKPGDVITAYDGRAVQVRWPEEMPAFNRMILETPLGKTVDLALQRGGKPVTVRLTTAPRGKAQEKDHEIKAWGATLRDITPLAAKELKRKDTRGVLITSVRPGGPCGQAKPAVHGRDIIVKVGGREVRNLADLRKITGEIAGGGDKPVPTVVAFDRKSLRLLTVVKIGPSEQEDRSPEVRKAWFSAGVQVFTRDLSEAMKHNGTKGVLVVQLYPGLPAEKAGFKLGDIITHVDGQPVEASHPADARVFPTMIRRYRIGSEVEMTVRRNGRKLKLPVKLVKAPVPVREMKKYKDETFEFTGRDVAFADRAREKWKKTQRGVYVEAVERAGWAALAGMKVGDLLLTVNGGKVARVADLEEAMKQIAEKKPKQVIFFVKRGIHTLFLEMEPDWGRLKSGK